MRAGAVGPDGFPDLIWGQKTIHVNQGLEEFTSGLPIGHPITQKRRDVDDVTTWRAIDYGMYLYVKALNYHKNAELGARAQDFKSWERDKRLQALAFSYGVLTHMVGDAFMHTWLNRQVKSVFDVKQGRGIFGPLTEELKHIAAEAWVDQQFTEKILTARPDDPLSNDPRLPKDTAAAISALSISAAEAVAVVQSDFDQRGDRCHHCNQRADESNHPHIRQRDRRQRKPHRDRRVRPRASQTCLLGPV
jgi:hypothetical protein